MTARDLLDAALRYAALGWRVLPVYEVVEGEEGLICACGEGAACGRPGKHPRTRDGVNEATTDERQILNWWTRWPHANVGIATGRASGILVVDADCSDGKPGMVNLTKLSAKHGGLPTTPMINTGSGGLHLYFIWSDKLKTGTDVVDKAIDVRSDGGYVIAPPSRHKSGKEYEWRNGAIGEPVALPEWLLPVKAAKKKRAATSSKRRLTLEQVAEALKHIDPDDRDRWLAIGVILGREFDRRDEAWVLYESWAARDPKFDKDRAGNLARMREMFFKRSEEKPRDGDEELTLGSLIHWAQEGGWVLESEGVERYEKFWAVRPAAKFLYITSGALWIDKAVNETLPPRHVGFNDNGAPIYQKPAQWLAQNRGIDSMVFDPALPQIVKDKVAREQGIVEDAGATMFNRYYPPQVKLGDAQQATPYVEHIHKLFPTTAEADHLIAWLAHRVQRPGEKVRHALLIGGPPGVGKDTIIEAVMPAIGAWNVASIAPEEIFKPFNEYAASVLIRINEVVDLHEISRYKFYEATKTLIAGNPEYIAINPKYGVKFHVRNCAGVIMTTNYGSTGMYLTADDRRHFAVETIELWGTQEERDEYFRKLWAWLYEGDGFAHVAAFLHGGVDLDPKKFNPNAPPPKTATFKKIAASSTTGDGWLTDALAQLGDPPMVRVDTLRAASARRWREPDTRYIPIRSVRMGATTSKTPARTRSCESRST
jgi:hypothetical protein